MGGTDGEEEDPAGMMIRRSGIREKILENGAGVVGLESQVIHQTDEMQEGMCASRPRKK
jgi:hypothetical protein